MLEWEALQQSGKLIDEKERLAAIARGLERIRQRQEHGLVSSDFDPRQIMLAMRSLTMFPAAFPQLTRMITGRPIHDPVFRKERMEFLKRIALIFRPASGSRVTIKVVRPSS